MNPAAGSSPALPAAHVAPVRPSLATMRTRQLLPVLVLLTLVGLTACRDEPNRSTERTVGIVTATIRHVAAQRLDPDDTVVPSSSLVDDDLPVVFVVSVGEEQLSAGVQADVASALRDEIDVRFSDARDEAIDADAEMEPVRDDGVLIVLNGVPKLGNPALVTVEIYKTRHEHVKLVFSVVPVGEEWEITETSEVQLDAT